MKQTNQDPPEKIYYVITFILVVAIILGVIWDFNALFLGSSKHHPTPPTPKPVATVKPAVKPHPTHKIVYTFTLAKGTLSAADEQNIGISWNNPTTGKNTLPSDIVGAAKQIASGSYSVTYDVNSVNKNNLSSGVNSYNDPDATINCSITVDGTVISTEPAPPNGGNQCSGIPSDSQSFSD